MKKKYKLVFVLAIILISCHSEKELYVPFSNAEIEKLLKIEISNFERKN